MRQETDRLLGCSCGVGIAITNIHRHDSSFVLCQQEWFSGDILHATPPWQEREDFQGIEVQDYDGREG